jgi:peptidoglycan/LPS O-acetylase OafA/YrhL
MSKGLSGGRVSERSDGRVPELDGLRGLAIALVIVCHYVANAEHRQLGVWPHWILSGLTFGWSGVDLFFVLSGFLIGGILLEARDAPHYFRAFYMRRVHRILPLYYLWVLLFTGLVMWGLWAAPGGLDATKADLREVPIHLLFLQNLQTGLPSLTWIWLGVAWSLAVEEQFYLVMPLLIRWLSIRTISRVLLLVICGAPLFRLLVFEVISPHTTATAFWMPCRADALAMGALIALAWRTQGFREWVIERSRLLLRVWIFLAVGVGLLMWWLIHPESLTQATIGYSWLAMFYGCTLLMVLAQKEGSIAAVMRWGWLRGLGRISYCVYLIHLTMNHLAHRLILHGEPEIFDLRGVGVTLLALVATLAIAIASWKYFEEPLVRKGHRYSYWDREEAVKGAGVATRDDLIVA